jgi:hypothetical protein
MTQLRQVFTIVCSLLVLTAGGPFPGFAWCLRGDGSLAVEATGPDGRCLDATAATSPRQSEPGTDIYPVASAESCVDLPGVGGGLLSNSTPHGGQDADSGAVLVVALRFLTGATTVSRDSLGPPALAAHPFSDIMFFRRTVSLVI